MESHADAPHIPFKRGDSDRKRKILELFSIGYGATAISRIVGGTESSVRKVRDAEKGAQLAAQAGQGNAWYQSISDEKLADCIAAARKEIPRWSTDIAETVTVRDITQDELNLHTYPHTIYKSDDKEEKSRKLKAGRKWMQERLTDPPKRNHHGFVIFPPSPDTDYDVVNERFTQLLDEKNYQKRLLSIFQSVQGKKGGGTSMGDMKRKQAKMSAIAACARDRVNEATKIFKKFADHTVSSAKAKALEELRKTEAEKVLVQDVIQHMCKIYNQVQEVSQALS